MTELILRCKTTEGVVEERLEHDDAVVTVSRLFAHRSALTHRLQLGRMGLTEVPSELFRLKHMKELFLCNNNLCSLPSEIALLATLDTLYVRVWKRVNRYLTKSRVVAGRRQPAHVSSTRARSADQFDVAQRAALEAGGGWSDDVTCFQAGNNQLASLPAEVCQLTQLEQLYVRNSN